jgi:hypothetical protein
LRRPFADVVTYIVVVDGGIGGTYGVLKYVPFELGVSDHMRECAGNAMRQGGSTPSSVFIYLRWSLMRVFAYSLVFADPGSGRKVSVNQTD